MSALAVVVTEQVVLNNKYFLLDDCSFLTIFLFVPERIMPFDSNQTVMLSNRLIEWEKLYDFSFLFNGCVSV